MFSHWFSFMICCLVVGLTRKQHQKTMNDYRVLIQFLIIQESLFSTCGGGVFSYLFLVEQTKKNVKKLLFRFLKMVHIIEKRRDDEINFSINHPKHITSTSFAYNKHNVFISKLYERDKQIISTGNIRIFFNIIKNLIFRSEKKVVVFSDKIIITGDNRI